MTICEIVDKLGNSSSYFDRSNMKGFNQKLSDFHVEKIKDNQFHIWAESYWQGHYMGTSERIYNATTNTLDDVPNGLSKGRK